MIILKKCRVFLFIFPIFFLFFFLNTNFASETSPEVINDSETLLEISNLLIGGKIPKDSDLIRFVSTDYYKTYKKYIINKLKSFLIPNNKKILKWGKKKFPTFCEQESHVVFYPFSGPDITNALNLFPHSNHFILFGLEPPGDIPETDSYTHDMMSDELELLRKSLFMMLNLNFFETKGMKRQLKSKSFASVAAIILFFTRMHGYRPIKIRPIAINHDAKIISAQRNKVSNPFNPQVPYYIPGIEFVVQKSENDIKKIQYFSLNVDDKYLTKFSLHFLNYLGAYRNLLTLIKSASYILHHDVGRFTIIRSYILANSRFIVQDDTGVPLKYFSSRLWNLNYYGVYDKPIKVFKDMMQVKLKKIFDKKSKGPLPFTFGYGKNSLRGSNIITAYKKKSNYSCKRMVNK